MSLSLSLDGPGDAELISAVRGGDVDAYGELFARHVDAARRLARQLAGPADADDLVSDAFTKVLTVLQRGGGPDLAFRAYLLTAVRRLHVDKIRAGSRLRPVDDLTPFDPGLPFQDTAVEGFDNAAAARAFASLPERWQMVLWHTEVEQQKPADIAPLLGMSANSVSALAYRAREGLRQAFLSQHATDPDDVDCAWTRDHLGAYVRGGLSRRDAKRVDDHLADCRACAAVYLELTEVNSGLAGLLAPLLLGAAGAKYASSLGGGAAAGGAGTSGFAAAQAWAAAHVGLTAIGGLAVTATALVAVYGATHLKSHEAADVGSGALASDVPSATSGVSPDGTGPGRTSSRGATDNGSASPAANATPPATTGTASAIPGVVPSTDAASSLPSVSTDTSTSTDASTDPSTDPSNGPTDPTTGPTDPGADDITFTSTPPIDPVFGSTYQVQATTGSGKSVTFSVDGTPANACAINGDIVSFDHAGTCVITAKVTARNAARSAGAGAAALPTSKVFSQTVVIPKGKQKIDFVLGDRAQVDGDLPLKADGGASGNEVTFSSETPVACSVNPAGTKVAFHHAATCTVTAQQKGSEDYKPADDVTRHVDVAKGDQHVVFNLPATAKVGDTLPLEATGGPTDNPVTFTGNQACTVDETGTSVTMRHTTGCTVTAHQDGNADYKDGTNQEDVTVDKGDQTVTFPTVPDGTVGTELPLQATSSAGLDVTFSTTDDSCAVQGSTVTFLHARPCVVIASAGNADWNDATAKQTVTIAKGAQRVTFPTVADGKVGTEQPLQATSSVGLDVTFTTTDDSCTVQGSTVTFVHARPCVVTASAGNADWNDASDAQTITVAQGDQAVDFATVKGGQVGTDAALQATSSAGLDVTFTTTDDSCTVQGSTVTFVHARPCAVTASAGNADWNDASDAQTITIDKGVQTIDFRLPATAQVGDTLPLTASGGASGNPVTFTDNQACTVDKAGTTVTMKHAATCTVTAHQDGNADYEGATFPQTVAVGKGAQSITFTSKVPVAPAFGSTYAVAATSDSGAPVTFSVDPATSGFGKDGQACTLAGTTVTVRHAGACVIAADQAGTDDYLAAPTARQTVTVPQRDQKITFTSTPPSPAFAGGGYQVSATGGASGNNVTFGSATPAVCTVAGSTVSLVGVGTCTVSANQAGNDDYAAAPTATQAFTVSPATDMSITAQVSDDPPLPDHVWHEVDVTIHDLAVGGTATVSGDSATPGVVVLPQFNCWFQVGGVCHVSSPPTTTTVKFYVLLPDSRHDARVTFTAHAENSPDPDPSNDSVTVTVREFED